MPDIKEHIRGYHSHKQRNLLLKIFSFEFSQNNLFITGGTALSVFYAEHRISKDIDLFLMNKKNLIEYIKFFRDIDKVVQTLSESPSFCSYIYKNGIKVDYVYDSFSANKFKNVVVVNNIKINVDTVDNIAINKICAVVSRTEPKDIVDLTWIFKYMLSVNMDFIPLFKIATKREGLLEDLLYVKGVFSHISQNANKILKIIKSSLLKNITSKDITHTYKLFENCIDSLVEKDM